MYKKSIFDVEKTFHYLKKGGPNGVPYDLIHKMTDYRENFKNLTETLQHKLFFYLRKFFLLSGKLFEQICQNL